MTIGYNGNVGIGTTSPNAKLDIIGDVGKLPLAIENRSSNNNHPSILCRGNAIATDLYNYFLNGTVPGTAGYVQTGAVHFINGPQRDADNGKNTYTIRNDSGDLALGGIFNDPGIYIANASRNVGIGKSNPLYKLDVGGNANISGELNVSGSSIFQGQVQCAASYPATGEAALYIPNGKVGIGTMNPSGKLHVLGEARFQSVTVDSDISVTGNCTANTFIATSDQNKKEDIETISDATEKLTSLRGVSYKLKEDEEKKTHYGVVAQEIEKVFPDMVHGEEGDKSVAYMEIIGVLIETVKDLNNRIKKLEESSK